MVGDGCRRFLRHGHLRSGGPDRRVHRLGQRHCRRYQSRHHPDGLGCHGAAVLCSARRAECDLLRDRAQAGLDQRGRSEAELTFRIVSASL